MSSVASKVSGVDGDGESSWVSSTLAGDGGSIWVSTQVGATIAGATSSHKSILKQPAGSPLKRFPIGASLLGSRLRVILGHVAVRKQAMTETEQEKRQRHRQRHQGQRHRQRQRQIHTYTKDVLMYGMNA